MFTVFIIVFGMYQTEQQTKQEIQMFQVQSDIIDVKL